MLWDYLSYSLNILCMGKMAQTCAFGFHVPVFLDVGKGMLHVNVFQKLLIAVEFYVVNVSAIMWRRI